MTKNEILNTLAENKSYIEKEFEVEKIGLFGSYAKDQQTQESDIDIYVEFKHNNKVILSNIQKDVIYG